MAKKTTTSKTLSQDELAAEVIRLQTELVEAKRSHAAKELTNTRRLSELRRSIARSYTALTKLNIDAENPSTSLKGKPLDKLEVKEKTS